MTRGAFVPTLALGALYVAILALTGLDWVLFRDEPLYLGASQYFADGLPGARFLLNVSGLGVATWGLLWSAFQSVAILRFSSVVFGLAAALLATRLGRREGFRPAWVFMALLISLPEVFLYSLQINGSVLSLALVLAVLVLYDRYASRLQDDALDARTRTLVPLGLWAAMAGAAINNPFLLAFPGSITAIEGFRSLKEPSTRGPRLVLVGVSFLALFTWMGFISLAEPSITHGLHTYSRDSVNPSVGGSIYPGNAPLLLSYLGGMFPFLPFAVRTRVRATVVIPIVAASVGWAILWLPLNGYAYDLAFHSVFTMMADTVVAQLGLPPAVVTVVFVALVALGAYNLAHVIRGAEKNALFVLGMLAALVYMLLMHVDGYMSTRIYLPGMVGLFFVIAGVYQRGDPRIQTLQILYNVGLTAAYYFALSAKYGFGV